MKLNRCVDYQAKKAGLVVIVLVGLATAGPVAAAPIPLVRWGFEVVILDPFAEFGGGISFPASESQEGVNGRDVTQAISAPDISIRKESGTGYPSDPVLRTEFAPGSDVSSLPLAGGSFVEVVIEPFFGRTINIELLKFAVGRTGPSAAPAGVVVRHSDDAFASDLFVGSITAFQPNQDLFAVNLAATGLFETVTSARTLRFFFFGPTTVPESSIDIDEIEFFGCVQPLGGGEPCSTVPEPSTLILAALAMPALLFRVLKRGRS